MVAPRVSSASALRRSLSVFGSRAENVSSNTYMSGPLHTALAIESLCFCPPDRLHPCWRTSESMPSGMDSTRSSSCAMCTALAMSASVLSVLPNTTLRLTDPENTTGVCGT